MRAAAIRKSTYSCLPRHSCESRNPRRPHTCSLSDPGYMDSGLRRNDGSRPLPRERGRVREGVSLRISHPWAARLGLPGFPKFTNEVQHQVKVLSWETDIHRSPLKSGVRLPGYRPRGPRSGKSLQVWIARHRRLLGSWSVTVHPPLGINQATPMNGPGPTAGLGHASIAIAAYVTMCCLGSDKVGRQSRSPAGLPMSRGNR